MGETLEQSVLRLRSCGKQSGFSSASTAQASRLDLLACDSLNQLEVSLSEVQGPHMPLGTLNCFREVKLGTVVALVFRCDPRFMWRLPEEVGSRAAGLEKSSARTL